MALYQVAVVEKIVVDAGLPTARMRERVALEPVTVAAPNEKTAIAKATKAIVVTDDMEVIVVPFGTSR